MNQFDVIIVGGGAAGMMAAGTAAQNGLNTLLLEKNSRLGRKLRITGKGRCNIVNNCDVPTAIAAIPSNGRFLYSAVSQFTPQDAIVFFENLGVPIKTERGNRVFPQSDLASDVVDALKSYCTQNGVQIRQAVVTDLRIQEQTVTGVRCEDGTEYFSKHVVIACGGMSYPATGSTGDGYRLAQQAGHTITELRPSLVSLVANGKDCPALQGLSLKNVAIHVIDTKQKKVIYDDFGEMMFTHFGVTGPLILSASAQIGKKLEKEPLEAFLDLKPALDAEQLDARILREFDANHNKQFKNVIGVLFPSSLTPIMIEIGGIPGEKTVHEISREERQAFGRLIKAFPFTITGMGEFKEAIITRGGVSVKEIQPSTMESKKIKNLYFTGEVLDLDAVTGGYNLQIAWSTAQAIE